MSDPNLTRDIVQPPEPSFTLTEQEKARGYKRPLRVEYKHTSCGIINGLIPAMAVSFAENPKAYGLMYCGHCQMHLDASEFVWEDGSQVGS